MGTPAQAAKSFLLFFFFTTITATTFSQVPLALDPFWESSESGVYSTGMIWYDADKDGYIDVFFSNGNDMALAPNTIYLSDYGTLSSLSASWSSTNAEYSGHCAVGDLNGDGFPEFVVANYLGADGFSSANHSNMYLNLNGFVNPSPDWYTADSMYSFSCALGDVDMDGDLDVIFATGEGYNSIYQRDLIYFNVNGTLQTSPGWQSAILTAAMDVTVGDVDNDGDLDLAFCYGNRAPSIFYNNSGTIETSPGWVSNDNEPGNTLVFGDVNGDGWLDLVVAFNNQTGGGGYYKVYFNDGTGSLNPSYGWRSSSGGYGSALSLYDYDNDGDDDLAAGRWWDRPRMYENVGGTFTLAPVWRATPSTVVEELAWVDVDGDGVELIIDTISSSSSRKLFYTAKHPLYSFDSVIVDGVKLNYDEYCFDLISGWVSLAQAPVSEVRLYYQYSYKNDLAVANWDVYNEVFGNTNQPYVDFAADITVGFAPLTVQFSDNSQGATGWLWRFGDGDSSAVQNAAHTFTAAGSYDVFLQALLPDGWHNHTKRHLVTVLADTLFLPDDTFVINPGDTLRMPIYLENTQPMESFTLPITWSGAVELNYLGFDTDSCRTDYFEKVQLTGFDPINQKLVFRFVANTGGTALPLEPGKGRLINISFVHSSGFDTDIMDTTTHATKSLSLDAGYAEYQPYVIPGEVAIVLCGDMNGNGAGPFMDDLTYLVDYLFRGGPPPPFADAADLDGSGAINIADLTYLVNYLFKGGPAPDCP